MDILQQISEAGRLNSIAFVRAANDLSAGEIIDFDGAVQFFNQVAIDSGIEALRPIFENIPAGPGVVDAAGNIVNISGRPNYRFLGPNAVGNIFDALNVAIGGASQGEIAAIAAANAAAVTAQAQADADRKKSIIFYVIGAAAVIGVFLVLKK